MNSVEIAKVKLQESDWSVLPDVEATLLNKEAFVKYREALRIIVIQKKETSTMPPEPVAVWSTPQV